MDFSRVHHFRIVQNGPGGRGGVGVVSSVGVGERKEHEPARSKTNAGDKRSRN
jgi:hypothetical protein